MVDTSLRVAKVAAPLRQQIIENLRRAITECRFLPGQRLVERELCELTGVSRTSIREALRQLESEGLIKSIPNRGPVVATVSVEEAVAIYEVRAVLEALAGRLFAERATTAQRRELQEAFREMEETLKHGNAQEKLRAKTRFYDVLMTGSGNPVLMASLSSIQGRITLLRATSLSSPGRATTTLREIRAIMDAIKKRDGDAAWRACLEHVRSAESVALSILKRQTEDSVASLDGLPAKGRRRADAVARPTF